MIAAAHRPFKRRPGVRGRATVDDVAAVFMEIADAAAVNPN
jgi:hypothetical protein